MTSMRAWQVERLGVPLEAMTLTSTEVPVAGPGQTVVRVRAAGLNFPDALMAMGQYQSRPSLPYVPGVELCADVLQDLPGIPAGTRVMGIAKMPHGSLAEFAVCETQKMWPAPEQLDDAEASAFTIAFQTAWLAVHHRGRLAEGESLVVHAASGGVGSAATILGKIAGARVIAVVGGAEKAAVARTLGADAVVDRLLYGDDEKALAAAIRSELPERGADLVFDPVGGTAFRSSIRILAPDGRLAVVGFAGGEIPTLAVNRALLKNIDVMGVFWGGYITTSHGVIAAATADLKRLVDERGIRPLVSERVPFSDAATAVDRLRLGASTGRIVVSLDS